MFLPDTATHSTSETGQKTTNGFSNANARIGTLAKVDLFVSGEGGHITYAWIPPSRGRPTALEISMPSWGYWQSLYSADTFRDSCVTVQISSANSGHTTVAPETNLCHVFSFLESENA